jgi:hypothetical protein
MMSQQNSNLRLADTGGAAASDDPSNRREHERHDLHREATAVDFNEFGIPQSSWRCTVVNISRSGMGICSRKMIHIGRNLLIMIQEPGHAKPRLLYGIARNSRYSAGEGHIVGLQFQTMPESPALRRWAKENGVPL